MARPIIDEGLWSIMEPLFPPPKPRRKKHSDRKPVENRKCLTGILVVLRTGIPWEDLPLEMGCGSGMTCWRRLRDWRKAGIRDKLQQVLLDKLNAADQLDGNRASADSSSVRAVGKGGRRGRIRPIDDVLGLNTISSWRDKESR